MTTRNIIIAVVLLLAFMWWRKRSAPSTETVVERHAPRLTLHMSAERNS